MRSVNQMQGGPFSYEERALTSVAYTGTLFPTSSKVAYNAVALLYALQIARGRWNRTNFMTVISPFMTDNL
jgi:hypothetical protein